jgi:glutamine synthetase
MAGMLMAGIAGTQNRIDPCSAGFGPIEEDILSYRQERKTEVKSLPTSLKEVLNALANDHQFLVQDSVFDELLIQEWI